MSNTDAVLRGYYERVQRLVDERKQVTEDIAEVFREAKSAGFSVPVLRKAFAERMRRDADPHGYANERAELDACLSRLSL